MLISGTVDQKTHRTAHSMTSERDAGSKVCASDETGRKMWAASSERDIKDTSVSMLKEATTGHKFTTETLVIDKVTGRRFTRECTSRLQGMFMCSTNELTMGDNDSAWLTRFHLSLPVSNDAVQSGQKRKTKHRSMQALMLAERAPAGPERDGRQRFIQYTHTMQQRTMIVMRAIRLGVIPDVNLEPVSLTLQRFRTVMKQTHDDPAVTSMSPRTAERIFIMARVLTITSALDVLYNYSHSPLRDTPEMVPEHLPILSPLLVATAEIGKYCIEMVSSEFCDLIADELIAALLTCDLRPDSENCSYLSVPGVTSMRMFMDNVSVILNTTPERVHDMLGRLERRHVRAHPYRFDASTHIGCSPDTNKPQRMWKAYMAPGLIHASLVERATQVTDGSHQTTASIVQTAVLDVLRNSSVGRANSRELTLQSVDGFPQLLTTRTSKAQFEPFKVDTLWLPGLYEDWTGETNVTELDHRRAPVRTIRRCPEAAITDQLIADNEQAWSKAWAGTSIAASGTWNWAVFAAMCVPESRQTGCYPQDYLNDLTRSASAPRQPASKRARISTPTYITSASAGTV
jgi:hypothetical protein